MATLSDLIVSVRASADLWASDLKDIQKESDKLVKSFQPIQDALGSTGKALTGAGLAISAIGVPFAIMSKGAIDAADDLRDMAMRTGSTVEALSALKVVAETSGTDLGALEVAMKKMNVTLENAASGNKVAAESLNKVGLSVQGVLAMKPEDRFFAIAQGLAGIEDPSKRAGVAVELFGKSGTDILPMLDDLAGGQISVMDAAKKLNAVVSKDTADSADKFNDSLTHMQSSVKGIFNTIVGGGVLDSLADLIDATADATSEFTRAHPNITLFAGAIGGIAAVTGPAITGLGLTLTGISGFIPVVTKLGGLISGAGGLTGLFGELTATVGLLPGALTGGATGLASLGIAGTALTGGLVVLAAGVGYAIGSFVNWGIETLGLTSKLDSLVKTIVESVAPNLGRFITGQYAVDSANKAMAESTDKAADVLKNKYHIEIERGANESLPEYNKRVTELLKSHIVIDPEIKKVAASTKEKAKADADAAVDAAAHGKAVDALVESFNKESDKAGAMADAIKKLQAAGKSNIDITRNMGKEVDDLRDSLVAAGVKGYDPILDKIGSQYEALEKSKKAHNDAVAAVDAHSKALKDQETQLLNVGKSDNTLIEALHNLTMEGKVNSAMLDENKAKIMALGNSADPLITAYQNIITQQHILNDILPKNAAILKNELEKNATEATRSLENLTASWINHDDTITADAKRALTEIGSAADIAHAAQLLRDKQESDSWSEALDAKEKIFQEGLKTTSAAMEKSNAQLRDSAGKVFDDMFIKGENVFQDLGNTFKGFGMSLGRTWFQDITVEFFGPIKKSFDDFFKGLLDSSGITGFIKGLGDKVGKALSDALGVGGSAAGAAGGIGAGGAAGGAGAGGGLGAGITGFLTNPWTIGIGAAIGIGVLWSKSQAHHEANTWVQNFQNPFDQMMSAIETSGGSAADIAMLRSSAVADYMTAMQEFATHGSDEKKVANQAFETFKQFYGSPTQYGVPIPQLKMGMPNVPYDNFPAFLHKGEAVLPARQADAWRSGSGGSGGAITFGDITIVAAPGDDGRALWEKMFAALEFDGSIKTRLRTAAAVR